MVVVRRLRSVNSAYATVPLCPDGLLFKGGMLNVGFFVMGPDEGFYGSQSENEWAHRLDYVCDHSQKWRLPLFRASLSAAGSGTDRQRHRSMDQLLDLPSFSVHVSFTKSV